MNAAPSEATRAGPFPFGVGMNIMFNPTGAWKSFKTTIRWAPAGGGAQQ